MLTEIACRNAKAEAKPRKLADSGGLYLFVTPTGFKSWRLKYRIGTTEKRLVLGSYPELSLRAARDRRDDAKRQIRDGLDPSIERKKRKAEQLLGAAATVQTFAEDWHKARSGSWKPHYATAVMHRLKLDVFPELGKVPIGDVTAPLVLKALKRIERRGSLDVARRVRQHLADLFQTAIAVGAAKFNPAVGLDRALKSRTRQQRPAVRSVTDAREVLKAVEAWNVEPTTRLASRLLALTAARPGMVRMAAPGEFEDLDGPNPIWRIPADKMKLTAERRSDLRFEFVVPLSPAAVDVVKVALATFAGEVLFPAARGKQMSDSTLSATYRSAGFTGRHVPHGWRATFSTVMNELAAVQNRVGDREIIDLMLAHVTNDVESAYNRYAYLPRRRELALEWSALLMEGMAPAASLLSPRKRGRPEAQRDGGDDVAPDAAARAGNVIPLAGQGARAGSQGPARKLRSRR